MRMIRKAAICFIVFALVFGLQGIVNRSYGESINTKLEEATALAALGLFKGGSTGFELDRAATRAESSVMLVRLLGKEGEALAETWKHPFTDVPVWANPYIGYLYEKGYTKGQTKNKFGSKDLVDAKGYATFILRSLNYNDSAGDFSWQNSVAKLKEIGLLSYTDIALLNSGNFLRSDMVHMSYGALFNEMKDSPITLKDRLGMDGVINGYKAIIYKDPIGIAMSQNYFSIKDDSFAEKSDYIIPQYINKPFDEFGVWGLGMSFSFGHITVVDDNAEKSINNENIIIETIAEHSISTQMDPKHQLYEIYFAKGTPALISETTEVELRLRFDFDRKLAKDQFDIDLYTPNGVQVKTLNFKFSKNGMGGDVKTYIYEAQTSSYALSSILNLNEYGFLIMHGNIEDINGKTRDLCGRIAVVERGNPRLTEELFY